MLGELGYRVLKARDAASALAIVESGMPIDLIFTDVMMPGTVRSPELARKAKQRLPNAAVLFTSGYTQNAIVHGGRLDPGVDLLPKPYTREALARKVRHVLANQAQKQIRVKPVVNNTSQDGLKGVVVLLVEDDEMIRLTTAEMLSDVGSEIRQAETAEEALRLFSMRLWTSSLLISPCPACRGWSWLKPRERVTRTCAWFSRLETMRPNRRRNFPRRLSLLNHTPQTR